MHDAEEEIEIQEESQEVGPLAVAPSPVKPSPAEIELHRLTHLPFRDWCLECLMGRGLGEARGRHAGRQHGIPIVGVDYFYMTSTGFVDRKETGFAEDEDGEKQLNEARDKGEVVKCLVVRCYATKVIFGHVVPRKGADEDDFVAKLVVADVAWMGHVKLIIKSDQEAAPVALITRALQLLRCQVEELESVSTEHSQAYDSQASGGTEVGIKILRGLFKTLKLCLEGRIGRKVPVHHPVTSWLLEHTSLLQNARVRGEDGMTAWARVRGRAFGQRLIGFGERILWKQPLKGPQHDAEGNMGPRLLPGIFLGYRRDATTYVIGLENGEMVESRAVTRRPMADRWKSELIEAITDTPWTMRTRTPAARVDLGADATVHPPHPDQPSLPRRLKITMKMLKQHGTTDGCQQ